MPQRSPARATRTVNPLPFDALEPHRFEDLVRQLAYGFRPWRALEATGRLGGDDGIDIRGIEVVGAPVDDAAERESAEADTSGDAEPSTTERIWTIQARRYKRFPKSDATTAVRDAVPDIATPPYGLIVAVAADARTDATLAFHTEAAARGVAESHLWTRATIEDMLFRPDNDHLLFAYFGISLRVRARSQAYAIRSHVALKRKLMRAFEQERIDGLFWADVLVRDVDDRDYPRPPEGGFTVAHAPWHRAAVMQFIPRGIVVGRYGADGWVKPDSSWDYEEASRGAMGNMGRGLPDDLEPDPRNVARAAGGWYEAYTNAVPAAERANIREVYVLPYDAIIEVDPIGDPLFEGTHLFCRYGAKGPYDDGPFYAALSNGPLVQLDADKRTRLFVPGLISVPYGDVRGMPYEQFSKPSPKPSTE